MRPRGGPSRSTAAQVPVRARGDVEAAGRIEPLDRELADVTMTAAASLHPSPDLRSRQRLAELGILAPRRVEQMIHPQRTILGRGKVGGVARDVLDAAARPRRVGRAGAKSTPSSGVRGGKARRQIARAARPRPGNGNSRRS